LRGIRENHYNCNVIASFGDEATADLYHGGKSSRVRRFPNNIKKVALRKLDILNAAHQLLDLRSPPGNRLEALQGDLHGFHSIRVNEQWRLIFEWVEGNAHNVKLVDYH
jgi:proteic killer suppression protein